MRLPANRRFRLGQQLPSRLLLGVTQHDTRSLRTLSTRQTRCHLTQTPRLDRRQPRLLDPLNSVRDKDEQQREGQGQGGRVECNGQAVGDFTERRVQLFGRHVGNRHRDPHHRPQETQYRHRPGDGPDQRITLVKLLGGLVGQETAVIRNPLAAASASDKCAQLEQPLTTLGCRPPGSMVSETDSS